MDLKTTVDIILKDLEEAQAIIDDLKNYHDVPAIQVELAKAKCRNAADVISVLTDHDLKEPPGTPVRIEEDTSDTLPLPDEDKPVDEPDDHKLFNAEEDKQKKEDAKIEPEEPVNKDSREGNPSNGSGKIIADTFQHSESLNEILAENRRSEGTDDVGKSVPVSDLTKAIGINDRYLFIREIFGGDQAVYSDAINSLNEADNLESANTIIKKSAVQNPDKEVLDQLMDLVRRKIHNNGIR